MPVPESIPPVYETLKLLPDVEHDEAAESIPPVYETLKLEDGRRVVSLAQVDPARLRDIETCPKGALRLEHMSIPPVYETLKPPKLTNKPRLAKSIPPVYETLKPDPYRADHQGEWVDPARLRDIETRRRDDAFDSKEGRSRPSTRH